MGIREGENLEIFIESDKIILQKQMRISNITNISQSIVNIIGSIYHLDILVTDRENIIVSSEGIENYINERLSNRFLSLMDRRDIYISKQLEETSFMNLKITGYLYIYPIIIDADVLGLIILRKYQNITEEEKNIIRVMKEIIANQLSIC